ncbi:ECU08_1425 [Encephalitozoon cuniculi GB-M1]|uniref:ECU08_1425 protein n=1 Tax=Encephalitozoon cuniculi (strain GB-M1) TaxID=284813 RepID=I7L4I2_ENCCU|nr:uncharacterized protein ECU08_1425 [Encephalitozoon cuniculi GB-M1]UYI27074.1 telomere length regulation protein TEN1 [Encephalitozoon cuniculi]CCI73970.1 ECU08_1425 [Encephalitozoon cuniculi GB-M1]
MLRLLDIPVEGRTVYSFGKVRDKLENGKYEVSFREKTIIITTDRRLSIGSWIRMYGTFKSGVLRTIFVGELDGVDINLLEKAVRYVACRRKI